MRQWISLFEAATIIAPSTDRIFYHGSDREWEPGEVLSGRGQPYEDAWGHTDFYQSLERYRPEGMIAHRDAVFMCDNDEDIDSAGGSTDWVLTLKATGPVERHDMNWSSAISSAISDDEGADVIEELARRYWSGEPSDDPLWEYLTPSAVVVDCEPF